MGAVSLKSGNYPDLIFFELCQIKYVLNAECPLLVMMISCSVTDAVTRLITILKFSKNLLQVISKTTC